MASGVKRTHFLQALFRDYYESFRGYILVRSVNDWKDESIPLFFPNTELAAKQSFDAGKEVFFGVCPRERMISGGEHIKYLVALWADLDIGAETHSTRYCFKDAEQAAAAIRAFPREPSIIVNSGRGRHLYWLLESPQEIVDPKHLDKVLSTICLRIGCRPLTAPDTELRLPGTLNNKIAHKPVRCNVEALKPSLRYSLEDFEDLDRPVKPRPPRRTKQALGITRGGDRPAAVVSSVRISTGADLEGLLIAQRGRLLPPLTDPASDETVAMPAEDLPSPSPGTSGYLGPPAFHDEPTVALGTEEISRLLTPEASQSPTEEPPKSDPRPAQAAVPPVRTSPPNGREVPAGPVAGSRYAETVVLDFDGSSLTLGIDETAREPSSHQVGSQELTIITDIDTAVAEDFADVLQTRTAAPEFPALAERPGPAHVSRRLSPSSPEMDSEVHPGRRKVETTPVGALLNERAAYEGPPPGREALGADTRDRSFDASAGDESSSGQPGKAGGGAGFFSRLLGRISSLVGRKGPRGSAAAGQGKPDEAKVIGQPLILVSGATRCRLVEPGTPPPGIWRAVIQPGRTFAGKPLEFYVGSTHVGQVRLPEDWRSEQNAPGLELAVTYDLSFVHVKIGVKGSDRQRRFHFPVEPSQ